MFCEIDLKNSFEIFAFEKIPFCLGIAIWTWCDDR